MILIKEALINNIKVIAFDPHGTLYNRLGQHELLKVVFTHGKKDISDELEEIIKTHRLGLKQMN